MATTATPFFQLDRATSHVTNDSFAALHDLFTRRVVSHRGDINWPPRSPDLTPADFFLWGYSKSKVYNPLPPNLNVLKQITKEINSIQRAMLQRAIQNFSSRLNQCEQVLQDSITWLNDWESVQKTGDITADEYLYSQTSQALRLCPQLTINLCRYLIEKFGFKYLLTGKVNQENLECPKTTEILKLYLLRAAIATDSSVTAGVEGYLRTKD
ncbi:unnamed protein product [Euphydryas editha]|uniref:Uncharacterized protein n=1 Tax=Euphydryas editha TaxID=104508 RepID=A0AAU9UP12_EUPED|nr:unnamed protein product [Euphydryas editha]